MSSKKNNINNDNDLKFTPLNIETPLTPNTKINLAPLNTSDGISINSDCNNIFIGFPNLEFSPANNNLANSINKQPSPTTVSPNIYYPSTPYPSNVPSMDTSNTTSITAPNSSIEESEEFPSEVSSEDLYSYNTKQSNLRNTYHTDTVNPLDILRNFDLSFSEFDTREKASSKEIDAIFDYISSSCPSILGTFKSYRMPYPIATLLIKKIIKATLNNKSE